MRACHLQYEIDDTQSRLNFPRIHQWLTSTYWWQYGLTPDLTKRGAVQSTLTVGVYDGNEEQVGYSRVVSDTIRFAWLADVYVAESHRRRGIATAMVRFALDHPSLTDVTTWFLAT